MKYYLETQFFKKQTELIYIHVSYLSICIEPIFSQHKLLKFSVMKRRCNHIVFVAVLSCSVVSDSLRPHGL